MTRPCCPDTVQPDARASAHPSSRLSPVGTRTPGILHPENRGFASSSPENLQTTAKRASHPVLMQTLAVLSGFALAALAVLVFLAYLTAVLG
jgi:hypothetical protein